MLQTYKTNIRWLMLLLCCGCQYGLFYCYSSPAAIEIQIESEYALNSVQYNLLFSMYNISSMIIVTIAGVICDKYNIGLCTFIFCLVITIGQFLFCLGFTFYSYTLMLIGRFILGICGEAIVAAILVILAIYFLNKEFNFAYAICTAVSERLASVLSYYITLKIQQTYKCTECSIWIGFYITLFSLCCSAIIAYIEYYYFSTKQQQIIVNNEIIITCNKNNTHWILQYLHNITLSFVLLVMLSFLMYSCVYPWIAIASLFMQITYGYSNIEANAFLMIPQGFAILFTPLIGILVDKIGHRCELLIFSSLLLMFAHAMFMYQTFVNEASDKLYNNNYNFDAIYGLVAISLSFSIFSSILFTAINIVLPDKMIGFGMGVMCAAYSLGLTIVPIFVGLLTKKSNYRNTQILFISISCLSFIVCITLKCIDLKKGKNKLKNVKQVKCLVDSGVIESYGSVS
eukprot:486061_1